MQGNCPEELLRLLAPILATSFHTVVGLNLLQKPCETCHYLAGWLCETAGCKRAGQFCWLFGFGRGVCGTEGICGRDILVLFSVSVPAEEIPVHPHTPTSLHVGSYHMPVPLHKNIL